MALGAFLNGHTAHRLGIDGGASPSPAGQPGHRKARKKLTALNGALTDAEALDLALALSLSDM